MILGYSLETWKEYGLKLPIEINAITKPHLLISGASGTGKSYSLKFLLRNLLDEEKVHLTFCNFKDSTDFRFLKNSSVCSYHVVEDCIEGFRKYYKKFKSIQAQSKEYDGIFYLLIFDEFPAFITWLSICDKKLATTIQGQLIEMLMLSRSYGFGIWMALQRPDSKFIPDGAKDNFFCTVALGNLSKEAKAMAFSGYEIPEYIFSVGEGVAKIDGVGCVSIKFPRISSLSDLEKQILDGLKWILETGSVETIGFGTDSSTDFT